MTFNATRFLPSYQELEEKLNIYNSLLKKIGKKLLKLEKDEGTNRTMIRISNQFVNRDKNIAMFRYQHRLIKRLSIRFSKHGVVMVCLTFKFENLKIKIENEICFVPPCMKSHPVYRLEVDEIKIFNLVFFLAILHTIRVLCTEFATYLFLAD